MSNLGWRLVNGAFQYSGAFTGIVPQATPVTVDLASGGKIAIGSSDRAGYLFVGNSTGATALYALLGPLSTTVEVNDPKTLFTIVGGTTNSINVYWDSTATQYSVENRTGSTASVSIVYLGR